MRICYVMSAESQFRKMKRVLEMDDGDNVIFITNGSLWPMRLEIKISKTYFLSSENSKQVKGIQADPFTCTRDWV